jgi:hypothetical protein|tara:strand:+ start:149 stop:322 length:174 start_codon:yes stop_codon:yes gene_type:complete
MNIEDYICDALDMASAWELPEEEFVQAVNDQARALCGMDLEPSSELPHCSPYAGLRF